MLFKLNSIGMAYNSYEILNQKDEVVYNVVGSFWTLGHKLSFQNKAGEEIAQIRQNWLTLRSKFQIELGKKGKREIAKVERDRRWIKKSFTYDLPGPDEYAISGNLLDTQFEFTRKDRIVATATKKILTWGDQYEIEIDKAEDDVAILAAVLSIHLCKLNERAAMT